MKLVAGLGNPGPKYETTRHNVGFLAVDRLAELWHASDPVSKSGGEIYTANVNGEKVILVKPQTFMNLSGRCIGSLVQFYKCKPEDLIVIHDDLDLRPMALRIKTGGGTGGHNGLKSIDASLGAGQTGYHRIRVGIGHPASLGLKIAPVDYVLQPYSDPELTQLDGVLDRIAEAARRMIDGDVRGAMNEFNKE